MYWFKKIVRAILSLLPLFLVLFIPSNSYALKHNITGMPLYHYIPVVTNATTGNQSVFSNLTTFHNMSFHVSDSVGSDPTMDLSLSKAPYYFSPRSNSEHTECSMSSSFGYNASGRWVLDSNNLYNPYFTKYSDSWNQSSSAGALASYCQRGAFNQNGIPPMNWGSINSSFSDQQKVFNLRSLDPYYYEYSSYMWLGQETYNGIVYESNNFTLDTVLGDENTDVIKSMNYFQIPFGNIHDIQSTDFTSIGNGTHIDFNFSILIQANNTLDISNISNTSPILTYGYVYQDGSTLTFETKNSNCTIDTTDFDQYMANIDFSCSMDFNKNVVDNFVEFGFSWTAPTGSHLFVANDGLSIFSIEGGQYNANIITDYDSTPGENIGPKNEGSRPWHAPGAPGYDMVDDNDIIENGVNWSKSLRDLFNFSFINPFAPLFNLFTDQNQCADIPTLAGMLHSEETTVCPWFDSNTRNIVTPIIGLSSMMLLFGFVVRWLGARSGNFFEDSGSIEGPGFGRSGDTLSNHGWRVKK